MPVAVRRKTVHKKGVHYSWVICALGMLVSFCASGLLVNFSVYLPYVVASGAVGSGLSSSALITIRYLFSVLTLPFVDRYLRFMNIRKGVAAALLLLSAAYFVFSVANSFPLYCVGAALSGVCYVLGGIVPISMMITRWFHSHWAFAFGLCMIGSGIASVVGPPAITMMVESTSLHTAFFMEACFFAAVAVFLHTLIRNSPKEKGLEPLADHANEKKRAPVQSAVPENYSGSRRVVFSLYLTAFLLGGCGDVCLSHLPVFYTSSGYDSMTAASGIAVVGLALAIGKCVYGAFADQFGTLKTDFVFTPLLVAGLALGCLAGKSVSLPLLTTAMGMYGFSLSLVSVGLSMKAKDASTPEGYAKCFQTVQFCMTIGMLFFSVMPGLVNDWTGSYMPIFMVFTGMAVVTFLSVILSYHWIGREVCALPQNSSAGADSAV